MDHQSQIPATTLHSAIQIEPKDGGENADLIDMYNKSSHILKWELSIKIKLVKNKSNCTNLTEVSEYVP